MNFVLNYDEVEMHLSKKTVKIDERQMLTKPAKDVSPDWPPRMVASVINSSEPMPNNNK